MKKLKLNKGLKIGVISILIILIAILSFLLYREVKYPGFQEQKNTLYSYNNKGTINYTVFLKPNILYDTDSLDEGQLYLTEFIDYIKTTLNYEFSGERETDIEGDYGVAAKVQGFTRDGEEVKNIWEKNYILVPQKSFSIKDKTISIKEEIEIKLDEYNTFAKEIIEVSKINCQTNLSIIMNVNFKGNTDKGPIEEVISPAMVIQLNTSMFQISGNTNIEKPGTIEETTQVQLPVNKSQVIFYGVIIGILSVTLILLIFFTVSTAVTDPLEKKLKRIFKKHGDRLVALNSEMAATSEKCSEVYSMEDLVRIADEIGKPIMYRYSPNYKDISKLYVSDETQVYSLDIHKMLMKPRTERKKKTSKKDSANNTNLASTELDSLEKKESLETEDNN